MTVKASVSISERQDAFARLLVADGQYSSLSAVVQHGLELLRAENEARQAQTDLMKAETAALRALLEKRAKGPFVTAEEFGNRIDAMLESKRRERGL
jgi:antitoxin ParD1/3/4